MTTLHTEVDTVADLFDDQMLVWFAADVDAASKNPAQIALYETLIGPVDAPVTETSFAHLIGLIAAWANSTEAASLVANYTYPTVPLTSPNPDWWPVAHAARLLTRRGTTDRFDVTDGDNANRLFGCPDDDCILQAGHPGDCDCGSRDVYICNPPSLGYDER